MNSQVKIKLPKLELKPFDGEIINWKPFQYQFKASVQEFSNLKTSLNKSASS